MSQKSNGMILRIRKSRSFKGIAVMLALSILFEMVQPTVSLALTEGPSQPEVQSFEPIGTTQMVDLFSGDFNYNIPLFNLPGPNGGYPVNLAYHAGVSMDDEATWVGLGWNLNVGSLVRNMRGLPDEFQSTTDGNGDFSSGDFIYTKSDMKESWTLGVSMSKEPELFGGSLLPGTQMLSTSISYNNYNGVSASVGVSGIKGPPNTPLKFGLSLDSDDGLGLSASVNLTDKHKKIDNDFSIGVAFNGSLSIEMSAAGVKNRNKPNKNQGSFNISSGYRLDFARNNYSASIRNKITSYGFGFNLKKSSSFLFGFYDQKNYGIFFNIQDYKNSEKKGVKRSVQGYSKNGSGSNDYSLKDFGRIDDGQITEETSVLPQSFYMYDAYNSTGQGLSGYFRSRRNDVGYIHDPLVRNTSWNIGASLEIETVGTIVPTYEEIAFPGGIVQIPSGWTYSTSKHYGIDGTFGFGWDTQQAWDHTSGNGVNEKAMAFASPEPLGIDETMYYQVHGEHTIQDPYALDHINNTDLTWLTLEPEGTLSFLAGQRSILSSNNSHVSSSRSSSAEREVRNTMVQSFTNAEVGELGEFDVKHYNMTSSLSFSGSPSVPLNRSTREMRLYMNSNGTTFQEENVPVNGHQAGYKVLNQDGTYYVYGLPAYNLREVQSLFSVDAPSNPSNTDVVEVDDVNMGNDWDVDYKVNNTHKFLDKKTTSPYAHSFLLTSVQGADYVDIKNDGPTDDDLGYWVKFDYGKYSDNYSWRAPYTDANYIDGQTYTREDDKGSYAYGEKEIWYLTRIETKSHIAIFHLSERTDNAEAEGEFINASQTPNLSDNDTGVKIDKIEIYDKTSYNASPSTAVPLQTVHFQYDYSLCENVPNQQTSGAGKLTLKKVWFTSNGSERGALNSYEFDYESITVNTTALNSLVNPDYDRNSYDSWGNYQPYAGGYGQHANFPYVNQTASGGWSQTWMSSGYSTIGGVIQETESNKAVTQEANDLLASTWSLKKIKLPSGGEINIEYESDDYSHVQHKVANQMFRVVKLGDNMDYHNQVYKGSSSFDDANSLADEESRRIYFRLEEPISTLMLEADRAQLIYDQYVEPLMVDEGGNRNLYFKSRMQLTKDDNGSVFEYVRGYLPLEKELKKVYNGQTNYNYGVLTNNSTQGGNTITAIFNDGTETKYAIGYVTIQPGVKKNGSDYFDKYHPMALSAWTYMQTSAPKLLNPSSSFSSGSASSITDIAAQFTNILNVIPSTLTSFGAIRQYCKSKRFAQYIDLENSGIRLASPDRKKFGGGHRVKNISITDNWSSDASDGTDKTYGQHFDYTTTDENGNSISSGVATYEPQLGGDENALKYPVFSWGKNKMFTNNNLFTEGPYNEDLFPGASVGYRKVTVTSLNTYNQIESERVTTGSGVGRTSGVTVHEYYTAKDFPTMVSKSYLSESNDTKDVFKVPIPIPLIGSISRNYYTGTQGFLIELNDMHGKPKSVKSFESTNHVKGVSPITESVYTYQSNTVQYQGEWVEKLDNEVTIIPKETSLSIAEILATGGNTYKRKMGIEAELFNDAREFKTFNQSIGLDFNAEIIALGFIPSFWPSISNHKTLMRTHVMNKVVHRSGILKKSTQRDLQTTTSSEIIAYDEKAGIPMVAKTTNEFGDDFYSYNIPAYYHYDNMGHAYQNIDYRFRASVVQDVSNSTGEHEGNYIHVTGFNSSDLDYLVRGDELLITAAKEDGQSSFTPGGVTNKRGYLLGFEYNNQNKIEAIIHFPKSENSLYNGLTIDDFPSVWNLTDMTDVDLQFRVIRSGRRNHYGSMAASYTTRGIPDFKKDSFLQTEYTTITDVSEPSPHDIKTPSLLTGTVLSASASLFKDDWNNRGVLRQDAEQNILNPATEEQTVDNPYLTGSSGIWRPYKSYSYVDERSAPTNFTDGNTSNNPDLKNDGLLTSDIPMFSYAVGELERFSGTSKWEWVSEITRFNEDSYELENVNRIGIHSSALYGYDNSLTIAVGGNASVNELGAVDFEKSQDYDDFGASIKQTNLNFHTESSSYTNYYLTDALGIKQAYYNGTNMIIMLSVPYSDFDINDYETTVGLSVNRVENVNGGANQSQLLNGLIDMTYGTGGVMSQYDPVDDVTYAQIRVTPSIDLATQQILPSSSYYTGKIRMLRDKYSPSENGSTAVSFVTNKAHTGKRSMKVSSSMTYGQQKLDLIKNKKYVLSMWISMDDENQVTFDPQNFVSLSASGATLTVGSTTTSKIIEGWQKLDIELSVDNNNSVISFTFTPGTNPFYVDDVRFSPKTGGITTYVYDPEKLWLRASLNVDNYATLFFYDEEGNLTLKKQETEKGVFTITESRGHVSEQN